MPIPVAALLLELRVRIQPGAWMLVVERNKSGQSKQINNTGKLQSGNRRNVEKECRCID
jgi:hypothetical protein